MLGVIHLSWVIMAWSLIRVSDYGMVTHPWEYVTQPPRFSLRSCARCRRSRWTPPRTPCRSTRASCAGTGLTPNWSCDPQTWSWPTSPRSSSPTTPSSPSARGSFRCPRCGGCTWPTVSWGTRQCGSEYQMLYLRSVRRDRPDLLWGVEVGGFRAVVEFLLHKCEGVDEEGREVPGDDLLV